MPSSEPSRCRTAAGVAIVGISIVNVAYEGANKRAGAAVDVFFFQGAALEILVIGPGRLPALGAVVLIDGQVIGRAGDPHLAKALVLGVFVVLKVGVAIGNPVVPYTVAIGACRVAPGAAATIVARLGEPVGIGSGGGL